MKKTKIIYWISTGLLSLLLLMSVGMYLFNNEMVQSTFTALGFPTYIIYPLAFAKAAAVVVLWSQKDSKLKEWAYAGLVFDFILAFFAHVMVNDGEQMGAVVAMILLIVSYVSGRKLFNPKNDQ